MGSGGRGENFLSPDQDNGFILADYPDDEHNRIDPFFVALAERFVRGLDAVGFPLCKGNVMATNPVWRKTESQWRRQVSLWAERRSPVAVLFADIFFDFQSAWGPPAMAEALRAHVTRTIQVSPAFLRELADKGMDHSVALGWFGRLSATRRRGSATGLMDLKQNGTFPLVASVRLWALKSGIAETATLGRIAALTAQGTFDANDAEELAAAFHHVTFVLLRQQLADARLGKAVGNMIDPRALTRRERTLLVDALKAIGALHKRARMDFTGQLF
jgi:signal-transduction protein with cAMP-binding, CBS, and nucleotidyltransferase domain